MEKFVDFIIELLREAAKQYGLGFVLILLVISGLLYMLHKSYMARLADKDTEIQRLADSYNQLLTKVLQKPISSNKGQKRLDK